MTVQTNSKGHPVQTTDRKDRRYLRVTFTPDGESAPRRFWAVAGRKPGWYLRVSESGSVYTGRHEDTIEILGAGKDARVELARLNLRYEEMELDDDEDACCGETGCLTLLATRGSK